MRNIARSFILICMLSFVTVAVTGDRDTPWLLSWPFFSDAPVPHKIIGGYGDWCVQVEGLHPGLDFTASHGDSVLLPTDNIRITRGCYFNQYSGYALAIGYDSASTEGWYLQHLKVDNYTIPPFTTGSVVIDHQALAPCSLYDGQGPLHMHLQWTDIPLPTIPPGYHNPSDYFEDDLSGYDEVQFNSVRWEDFLSPSANRGIWFTPDNYETYTQLGYAPGGPDQNAFQQVIYGAVDIAVAPYSAFQGIPEEDSAGVYAVAYEILRQDPITGNYSSAAPDTGNFGQRWLMEMRDELPPGNVPEYHAIFPDGLLPNGGGGLDPDWWYNMNAYIVTNSGALDPSSWQDGLSNVWTTAADDDWTDGICRGAWNTFLAKPEISGDPGQNSEAFFPDGRYAVEVTAVSHGARDTLAMKLPVNDLSIPGTKGVVVDNHLPFIVGVTAWELSSTDTVCMLYTGYWVDSVSSDASGKRIEYLNRLRTQLDDFQSVHSSETPRAFRISDMESSSELDPFLAQAGNTEMVRSNSETPQFSDMDPGSCFEEDLGHGYTEFLLNEIAEVEHALAADSVSDRTFFPQVHKYLPMDGKSLILQVFYSEPIDRDIIDKVYFRSYIGPDTSWFEHDLVRLPPNFSIEPLVSHFDQPALMSEDNALIDSSNVVYYICEQQLPSHYMGNILLYFGPEEPSEELGPRDLAGNPMDSDPAFRAAPREDYGPFSYVNFSEGQDVHYKWDPPNWSYDSNTHTATGMVGSSCVAQVNLDAIGLATGLFLGDCDYYCGFWFASWEYGSCGFDVNIVKPDGSFIPFHFSTPRAFGDGFYLQSDDPTGSDGRYCWLTGHWSDVPDPDEPGFSGSFAYRVDALELTKYQYDIVRGYCFGLGTYYYLSRASLNSYSADHSQALYVYGYFYRPVLECHVSGTVWLPLSSTDTEYGLEFETSEADSDAAVAEFVEVVSNPVRNHLALNFQLPSGSEFQVQLYDIAGRQVLATSGQEGSSGSTEYIDVTSLPSGIYVVRMVSADQAEYRTISIIR